MAPTANENQTKKPCHGDDLPDSIKYAKYQGNVCITGISGRVGQCNNLDEFKDVLWNKKHAFTDKPLRYDFDKYQTGNWYSYVNNVDKFDPEFFNIDLKKANYIDPNIRLGLEHAYEAIVDAGYSIEEMRGSKTGVYASCVGYDASNFWNYLTADELGEGSLGHHNSFRASQISYALDLRGPSMALDTACSGFLAALQMGMMDIRLGNCDQALIVGSQLQANPWGAKFFKDIGAASPDGVNRNFDDKANGMSRGETVGVMLLQREEDARRIHTKVVHALQGCDGNSGAHDFNHPSATGQIETIAHCYKQAGIDPQTIPFVECHGTGTKAGDGAEGESVDTVFTGDNRKEPLWIGSVKTNVGHAEAAAGFNSVAKCIFGFRENVIIPNINYDTPSRAIPGLIEGRLRVPVDFIPWDNTRHGIICGVTGFGLGGNDSHAILKKHIGNGETEHSASRCPRLFTYGARTEEGLKNILTNVQSNAQDVGFQALLEPSANQPVERMPFRGFTLLNTGTKLTKIKPARKRQVVFACSGLGCHWPGMGKSMMKIDLFRDSIEKNCKILKDHYQIDAYGALKNGTEHSLGDENLMSLVTIPCMQIALVDMLNALGIKSDYVVGHGIGEIAAGYADGCLTREEAILLSVCHLKAAGSKSDTELRRQMKQGGFVGKTRSSKWLSTAYPKEKWNLNEAKLASIDYFAHNYVNGVRFDDVVHMLPKDAMIIEIAPSGLLQTTLKKSMNADGIYTSLMDRNQSDNATFFLESIGNIYTNGADMKPLGMFQEVKFPVQPKTPMISPMISKQWNHSDSYKQPHIDDLGESTEEAYETTYDFAENGNGHFIWGHAFNNMFLFPGVGYLKIASEALAQKHNTTFDKLPVVFENIVILRATRLPEDGKLTFRVRIMQNGDFELTEAGQLIVTGRIRRALDAPDIVKDMERLDDKIKALPPPSKKPTFQQSRNEIYLVLTGQGLDYLGKFRGLKSYDGGHQFDLEWTGEWFAFLDFHLQAMAYTVENDSHFAPLKMDAIYFDASKLQKQLNAGVENPVMKLHCDPEKLNYLSSDVFKIKNTEFVITSANPSGDPYLDEIRFVPFLADTEESTNEDLRQYATDCLSYTIKGLERLFMSGKFPHLSNNKDIVSSALKDFQSSRAKTSDDDLSKACARPGCGLAQTLKKIFAPEAETNGPKGVAEIITSHKKELSEDCLMDNLSSLDILEAALEIVKYNSPNDKATVLEVDAASSRMYRYITPYLLVRAGINYTATDKDDLPKDFKGAGYKAVNWDLSSGDPAPKTEARLMVLKNVLHKQKDVEETLQRLLSCVVPGGFILVQEITHNFPLFVALEGLHQNISLPTTNGTREFGRFMADSTWQTYFAKQGLDLVYRKSDGLLSTMYLLRKKSSVVIKPEFFRMEGLDYAWFDDLKKKIVALEEEPAESGKRLWLLSETANSGIFGFVQCIRKEPGGDKVRFVLSSNTDKSIDKAEMSEDCLKQLVQRDLYQNIFRNGQYGFFARKPLDYSYRNVATASDAYVSVPTIGDPSSAKWTVSSKKCLAMDDYLEQEKENYVTVYYASINDRDILNNNGEVPRTFDLAFRFNTGSYGWEFAGRRKDGSRVCGLVPGLALATGLNHSRGLVFDVPDDWTMEEAATVPYCYLSVYYALVVRNRLTEGQTMLVHSGATPMGTAAIRAALNVKATVYTTVYSEEEKKQLKKSFPRLPASRVIMRTGDDSVHEDIAKVTDAQGVDIVLSPTADESLFEESISCLGSSGQYIEIGRPVTNDAINEFAAKLIQTNMEYFRVDAMMILNDKACHKRLLKCINDDINKGVIKPLPTTVFEATDISKAFVEASQSRVLDKCIVQIREEEEEFEEDSKPTTLDLPVTPRVTCDPTKSYILCGGLGGFGLELAHWLVKRGARNLILTSRRGITNGYQEHKMKKLREEYKANVKVIAFKLTSTEDAKKLLRQAQEMGPVGGIFVLSLVLHDHFFSVLTKELFAEAANSKIKDTIFMDEASREMLGPELDWFVPFSSIGTGLGNASQTNYCFGNSVMERTCEQRNADGLHGIAIQWGAIGDVGALMVQTGKERELQAMHANFEAMGFGAQRIDSCLHVMDTILLLKKVNVVASYQRIKWDNNSSKQEAKSSLCDATCKVFGMNTMDHLGDDVTLGSMGLDSLMGVEVTQILERDFDIQMSVIAVRKLTIGRIREIDAALDEE